MLGRSRAPDAVERGDERGPTAFPTSSRQKHQQSTHHPTRQPTMPMRTSMPMRSMPRRTPMRTPPGASTGTQPPRTSWRPFFHERPWNPTGNRSPARFRSNFAQRDRRPCATAATHVGLARPCVSSEETRMVAENRLGLPLAALDGGTFPPCSARRRKPSLRTLISSDSPHENSL